MKLREFFNKAVACGIENDPRGKEGIDRALAIEKRIYNKLSDCGKGNFDEERLTNPFHDSRVLFGADDVEIKRMMVGVDLEVPELLVADRLGEKGQKIDFCLTHHPQGYARTGLWKVMEMQAEIMANLGVPITAAEGLMDPRKHEIRRRVLVQNHTRVLDSAKLLDMPYACVHTPADNCVVTYLQDIMDKEQPLMLGEVIDILGNIPEYKDAKRTMSGLMILARSASSTVDPHQIRAGKVYVDMTGGTGGSKDMFEKFAQTTDVGTIVCMHIPEDNLKLAKKYHMNIVIAGHIASDNLGINLLLDNILKGTDIEVVPVSGFERIER